MTIRRTSQQDDRASPYRSAARAHRGRVESLDLGGLAILVLVALLAAAPVLLALRHGLRLTPLTNVAAAIATLAILGTLAEVACALHALSASSTGTTTPRTPDAPAVARRARTSAAG